MATLTDDLRWRGLIHQATDPALEPRLDAGGLTVYIGFDPTAPSLHVGNLLQLCTLRRLQLGGHQPIALAGGGTGMIGDPGGRSGERSLLGREELAHNLGGIEPQLGRFLDFTGAGGTAALLLDNAEWLAPLSMVDYLRDIGKHFTVNQMVAKESVKARFERPDQGISYTEFSYMLLQAFDYLELFRRHDCRLQVGGSDQWGNITMGVDLVRKVERAEDFLASLASARREASSSFGDDRVLLETFVARPRHLEVQIFADSAGRVVHLFERDCSLQRRHQKVIEEAPAPGLDEETRSALCAAAVRAAEAVAYQGAGTVEFIADASEGLRADRIWFMEMNTRLQVEHPVTEAITGLDLVEWQLRVASGEPLPLSQNEIVMNGHAVEARLYAEDPNTGFLPSTGPLRYFHLPWNVRRDNAVDHGDVVSPYYDPMIAKLIAHADTRQAAIVDLTEACADVQVWPVKTNAGFLTRLLKDTEFRAGDVDTGLIGRRGDGLAAKPEPSSDVLAVAAWMRLKIAAPLADRAASPWVQASGFRLNAPPRVEVRLQYAGKTLAIPGDPPAGEILGAVYLDEHVVVFEAGETYEFSDPSAVLGAEAAGGDGAICSPMPGKIAAVHVAAGDKVARGAALVTLEAMKMEHALTAPFDGVVAEVAAVLGEQVSEGVVLARVEAEP